MGKINAQDPNQLKDLAKTLHDPVVIQALDDAADEIVRLTRKISDLEARLDSQAEQ